MIAHVPHHGQAGAATICLVDIAADAAIVCSTEPDNLPNSGTPHPSERGIFMPVIQAHSARFQSREGWRINRKANTQRGLLAVISLPAPIISMGVNSDKPTGGHHGQ